MNEDDDGLPVLTQVLRIGGARAGAAPIHATSNEFANELANGDVAASALDEILLSHRLVIGTEPRQQLEPYIALTTPTFDPSARHDHPRAKSSTHSSTRPLIVPFTEPVDVPAPSDGDATLETVGAASSAVPSDPPPDAALPEVTEPLVEEAGPERRDAANDADDDSRDTVVAIEPAIDPAVASADESALVDASTPLPFDHDAFAVRVREAVLNDLSARIDTELDARIAQTLHAELEAALASLQDNLREKLAEAMRDVVRRAVDEQVARLSAMRGE